VLRAASAPAADGSPAHNLSELAIELVTELRELTGVEEPPAEPGELLEQSIKLIEEMRAGGERDKLVADLRRTSGAESDGVNSLRELQERARRPDLRRVGR